MRNSSKPGNTLNDDFPSLPKKTLNSSSTPDSNLQKANLSFSFGSDPDKFSQTDLTQHDFAHALNVSLSTGIPDPPTDTLYNFSEASQQTPKDGYPDRIENKLLQPDFFKNYDLHTLFYIFFYHKNTNQQYFVAKELKERGWMFNKKYHTWFHLVSPAKDSQEKDSDIISGTFEYFDVGTSEDWCIRRCTTGFKFEKQYLED